MCCVFSLSSPFPSPFPFPSSCSARSRQAADGRRQPRPLPLLPPLPPPLRPGPASATAARPRSPPTPHPPTHPPPPTPPPPRMPRAGMAAAAHLRAAAPRAPAPAGFGAPARPAAPRRGPPPAAAVKEIFMPALSSTMTEGKIVSWLKAPGDAVAKGESVVVVESDKADMDVESFNDGILGAVVVPEGGMASVGDPIAYIAETEADLEAAKSKASGSATSNGAAPAALAAKEVCRPSNGRTHPIVFPKQPVCTA